MENAGLIEEPITEDYNYETTCFIEERNNLDTEIERSNGEEPSIEIFVENLMEDEEELEINEEENLKISIGEVFQSIHTLKMACTKYQIEGFSSLPRLEKEILKKHDEVNIQTSIPSYLVNKDRHLQMSLTVNNPP